MTCAITDFPEPRTLETLSASLSHIRQSPQHEGTLALIVRRPQVDAREVLADGELNTIEGLAGDTWNKRGSSRTSGESGTSTWEKPSISPIPGCPSTACT